MSDFGNGDFKTPYGVITIRNPGRKEAPPNLQTLKRRKGGAALPGFKYTKDAGDVVLQGPALRAFREAEKRCTPDRLRKKGLIQPIELTGVGFRSYALQSSLYYGPDNVGGRYADPDGSLHCEALAGDLKWTFLLRFRNAKVKKALVSVGFHFAISGEPWHGSFFRSG
jgi:hypothetical protein